MLAAYPGVAQGLLSSGCRAHLRIGDVTVKFETFMLHGLFIASLVVCGLILAAMLTTTTATPPVELAPTAASPPSCWPRRAAARCRRTAWSARAWPAEHGASDNTWMLHVILHRPEIPPNTGNVIRLCANTGAALHLVRPLGFELDDARLRRAGLDYHEYASVAVHDDLSACLVALGAPRVFAFTTRGSLPHVDVRFADGDALLFGCETAGLPDDVLDTIPPT